MWRIALLILSLSAGIRGQQQPAPPAGKHHLPIECDHAAPPRGTHWVCKDPANSCNCQLESDTPGKQPLDDDEGPMIGKPTAPEAIKISADDFYRIMNMIAQSESEGNASKAADMFAEDAVYSNPAQRQVRKGRPAIAKLLGGNKSLNKPMTMQWHHLLFNEQEQVGAGEFTQEGARHYHGMVIVKVEKGKISRWREYEFASSQSWDKFTGENQF
ncbi:MAG TPA: nuclear transport factor 2 family protein [Candidatus Angelobacter sp.]|nr:nuclear transport factor 2 family protein [Candidatus Angelobacter sp.]